MKYLFASVVTVYNLCLIVGTAYMIEYHHWSPWWYLLTMAFIMTLDYFERKE